MKKKIKSYSFNEVFEKDMKSKTFRNVYDRELNRLNKNTMINLGDKVKDPITGLTGIAVGRTTWLHGCDRIVIQPEGLTKEGKPFESLSVDEPQLVVLKKKQIKEGVHDTGGPRAEVKQKGTPSRY